MIYFQERMDKTILKQATLKCSTHLNMQQPREKHDEALNVVEENGEAEFVQELE